MSLEESKICCSEKGSINWAEQLHNSHEQIWNKQLYNSYENYIPLTFKFSVFFVEIYIAAKLFFISWLSFFQ